ncbi:MAG: carbohydrate ABC transporter permease [Treponemataceae bacterium]
MTRTLLSRNIHFQTMLFFLPALILLLTLVVGPVLIALSFAFTNLQLTGAAALNTKFIGGANFSRALADPRFYNALIKTLSFLVFSSFIGQQVLGFFLALLMKERNPTLRRFAGSCVLAGWVCPEAVAGMCFVAFYAKNGTLDKLVSLFGFTPVSWLSFAPMMAVVIANIWRGTAFSMLMFQAALDKIPTTVEEASLLDGANRFQKLIHIIVPMLKKDILTNMILNTLSTLGVFGMIFMLTRGGPGTQTQVLSLFLYEQAFIRYQLGYGTAISVIILLISMILNVLYIKMLNIKDN